MQKSIVPLSFIALAVFSVSSCGTSRRTSSQSAVESKIRTTTSLEGVQVKEKTVQLQGVDLLDALSEDGMAMVKLPFKWFAGVGTADNEQVAIELAQREAYATISRVLTNAVLDESERGNVVNNGRVQQALTSHWKQFSTSLERGCEPIGNTSVEYNPATRMYKVTAKVGIRGDRFNQLLNTAGDFKPSDLSGAELEQFVAVNKAIMNAAKGN